MTWFPALIIYFKKEKIFSDNFLLGVSIGLIGAAVGVIFACDIFKLRKKEENKFFKETPKIIKNTSSFYTKFLCFLFLCFLALFLYYHLTPRIPILEILEKNSPEEMTLAREQSFKLLDPRWSTDKSTPLFYLFLFLRTTIFPFLILLSFGFFLQNRNLGALLIFLAFLVPGIFYASSTLARAPVAAIFFRIFLFYYVWNYKDVKILKLVSYALLILLFPLFITTFVYKEDRTLLEGLLAVLVRMTITPAEDLYYFFEIFPAYHSFLLGDAFLRPFYQIFGYKSFYIENYVSMYINPNNIETAHTNAVFISNLYADFGKPGILIGSFIVGFFLQYIQIILFRMQKNFLTCSLFAFFCYLSVVLNFGSVTSVLLANGGILVLIIYVYFASKFSKDAILKQNKTIKRQS